MKSSSDVTPQRRWHPANNCEPGLSVTINNLGRRFSRTYQHIFSIAIICEPVAVAHRDRKHRWRANDSYCEPGAHACQSRPHGAGSTQTTFPTRTRGKQKPRRPWPLRKTLGGFDPQSKSSARRQRAAQRRANSDSTTGCKINHQHVASYDQPI